VSTGAGIGAGFSMYNTRTFGMKLTEVLYADVALYRVISPKDVRWGTSAARNSSATATASSSAGSSRGRAIYLNAAERHKGVLDLLDRMDHCVVDVSSTTPSLLW
jgi:hypothetical protein